MERQNILIRRFYRGDDWKIARAMKIASVGGRCEKCGAIGTEVHHIIHLTPENVSDPEISLNQENLMLLCNECHNKVHGRFEGSAEYKFDADGNLIHIEYIKTLISLSLIFDYRKIKKCEKNISLIINFII